jgi:branched-chain amino acid aminotransferase
MAARSVWVNGERQSVDRVHVSAHDRGLTLADGVFETMRVRGGTVFRLDQHLARISSALETLAIAEPWALREWVMKAVRADENAEASVRLTVTRGVATVGGVPAEPDLTATVIVSVAPLRSFPPAVYERGLTAQVASGRRNERAMTAGLKTLGYTDAVLALIEAQRSGADEALFLDTQGHCSEATSSNLFLWTGAALRTPPTTCAALPGITRAAVIEVARTQGLVLEESEFGLEDLLGAAEAFLTSSLRGIAPLVRVDGRAIGAGVPGAMTRRLADDYRDLVARECGP